MAWCIWIVMNVYYKERIWIYYLISFYSKMQPLFCLVPTNLSTQFPSWHELTQRPHNSAISVPDLKWSYFAFKGSEQLELPLNWNRIGPLGIEVNEKIFHSVSIFQYPLSQAAADLQPYGCFIFFLPCNAVQCSLKIRCWCANCSPTILLFYAASPGSICNLFCLLFPICFLFAKQLIPFLLK